MEPLFRSVQQKLDRLNTVLQENIAGARLVKAFVRADREGARFGAVNEDLTGRSVRALRFMSTLSPALTVCINIGMVLVIGVGGRQAIAGRMTIGQIVAFTNYLLTTMTPLIMMTMLSNVWAGGLASAKRVREVLATIPEVQDAPDAADLPSDALSPIGFEHVSFHYRHGSEAAVLEDIELAVEAGRTAAVLGATGSGKSSLVLLVPRFYDVTTGSVRIDGADVRGVRRASLLGAVGFVPQDTVLFSGTVRDNIRFGRPDASEADVVSAAQTAQAHEFIMALPRGYDGRVEARGANFSGGQKQRLAIARALLLRPRILVLDDSTSAVDIETETRIQAGLAASDPSRTTLIVAQRISTVLNADLIVVLDKGRIVARGRHGDLIRTSPIYREIYDSQLGGDPATDGPGDDSEGRPRS
jgi:ATP-binding cassette subfamily B protein